MKNTIYTIILSLLLISCQGSGGNDNPVVVPPPVAPMNSQCVANPAACQQGVYQQGYGFQPYTGYQSGYHGQYANGFHYINNSAYLCSCPVGTAPTYNTYGGLGCVSVSLMNGYGGYAYFRYGYGADNRQWVNIPQISNYTGYSQANCYNGVVQSCIVGSLTSCSAGFTCRASAAQSRLGLCVSSSAATTSGTVFR